jgi:hypothetical protein
VRVGLDLKKNVLLGSCSKKLGLTLENMRLWVQVAIFYLSVRQRLGNKSRLALVPKIHGKKKADSFQDFSPVDSNKPSI